jgi:23S rRNA (cytidine1920-2'-O)/16S rRNA (cytidine1409-2'-O)-methyltransferase
VINSPLSIRNDEGVRVVSVISIARDDTPINPPSQLLDFPTQIGYPVREMKVRLDVLLVERGLVESREQGRRLIQAGQVLVGDQVIDKPGTQVPASAELQLKATLPYVSRGGLKLAAALDAFGIDPAGKVCLDVGASTGGFTDCLLQRGALRVYAVDVGYGQLAWTLRQDPRVVVMERTNIRYLESLPEPCDLATIDVSFISLELVLPAVVRLVRPGADIVALIKPQFEAGKGQVGKGGVVRDPAVHQAVLEKVLGRAQAHRLTVCGLICSPLEGPAGNVEFLAHLRYNPAAPGQDLAAIIAAVIGERSVSARRRTNDQRPMTKDQQHSSFVVGRSSAEAES